MAVILIFMGMIQLSYFSHSIPVAVKNLHLDFVALQTACTQILNLFLNSDETKFMLFTR